MNRRSFVLSWGRKLFFGFSWPLTSLLSLIYLRSYIIPQTTADWAYFLTTFIGHFGILNAIVYFLIYCPIVLLMPSYYVSRFWSLILIMALNTLVLADALLFSSYHIHIYSFLSKLVFEKGLGLILGSTVATVLIPAGFLFISLVIWIRGEWTWRYMQSRFSNPVKNWYLVLIIFCMMVGRTIYHYGDIHPTLSNLFPVNVNFKKEVEKVHADNRAFFYPSRDLNCVAKENDNFILITLKRWSHSELNPELMPNVEHMKTHGMYYNSHYPVASNENEGAFTLKYSIPASYESSVDDKAPAFMTELEKRKYEMVNADSMTQLDYWISSQAGTVNERPYFLNLELSESPAAADKTIQDAILILQKKNLLHNTYIVMTADYGGEDLASVPLLIIDPDRTEGIVDHVTSHYDLMPTLMQNMWGCKKVFKLASVGVNLNEKGRDWLLMSNEDHFKIIDFTRGIATEVGQNKITDKSFGEKMTEPRHELIFEARKIVTKFSKPW